MLMLFTAAAGIGMAGRFLFNMAKTLPSPSQLHNIQPPLVSKVYAADGSLVHEFSVERRFWVPLDQIPRDLHNAVIAIEDRRFYRHWGIDIRRIFGAALANLLRGGIAQGGSTLTQQLARNVYLTQRQSLIRKVREAMTAVQIERYYTKKEIIELYLNQVYLGAGVYGVEAASQQYFSKPAAELTLNECAVLAGCIQLPEHYRPDKPDNIKRITARRNAVLSAMKEMGFIDRATASAVAGDTIPSNPQKRTAKSAPYFIEMVRQYMEQKYGEQQLYNGGLEIHTTLDPYAQDTAENAMRRQLKVVQRRANRIFLDSTNAHRDFGVAKEYFLAHFDSLYSLRRKEYEALPDSVRLRVVQSSVVAIENRTGAIRVLIGGRDFSESKFNRALQARRQPGSAFKVFVYAAAIDSGYTPASLILDQAITLETPDGLWRPENYDRQFYGPVTVREAIKKSMNIAAIQVLMDIGAQKVVEYARRMGLKQSMNPVPALAIGACQATPMEMTSAYSIFANNGVQVRPYFIERVIGKHGRVLEEHSPVSDNILSPRTAFIMTSLLQSVVTGGTAASIPGLGFTRPAAGKTGTTNDYSDAWFIGFTPQITCGVWVGVDERRGMGSGVTGAFAAIPIWVPAMAGLHRSLPVEYFHPADGVVMRRVCSQSHKIAREECPKYYDEYFIDGVFPDSCTQHGSGSALRGKSIFKRFGSTSPSPSPPQKAQRRKLMF